MKNKKSTGEYGLKIKNYEAGSIVECNQGVRTQYHTKDAMLTNSLFLDFLLNENLIDVYKGISTRDIICVNFNYGSKGYDDEIEHLDKLSLKIKSNLDLSDGQKEKKLQSIEYMKDCANKNQFKFKKMTKAEIRMDFYNNGVIINYPVFDKQQIVGHTSIKYLMAYRTPGKAKKGSCMFVNEKIFPQVREFLYMGLKLPEKNAPIVEIGAYSSLITSTIVDRIYIDPKNILVLDDVVVKFITKVKSIEVNKEKECFAKDINAYPLKNEMFDGQALIDTSIFPIDAHGYILLRHHFTKMAAFHTNIQLFFKDYFGEQYDTAIVKDMFGVEHFAKDIKLITTNNAIKWLKFKVSYDYWCNWVYKNGCMFGIVKTAHESKIGNDMQRMSYQMVNSLDIDTMEQVSMTSLNYIEKLKNDDSVFLDYLKNNSNFSNDYDVLIDFYNTVPDFSRSTYFRERRTAIIKGYLWNLKNGRLIQNAENLTIVGSPYAMLLHSVGEVATSDPTFTQEKDSIQCYTERFDFNTYLTGFRSPFNSRNNMSYLHNVDHEYFHRYFNFGRLIIAVNLNGTDFQDRNNGSDQDSDSLYVTNQENVVAHAKYCYANYPTIVNNIPKDSNHYDNTMDNFAIIDNSLAASQLNIGESSNLAQVCLSYTYNWNDEKYLNAVCILSVLAQVAIDSAKRKFDVDITKELQRIKVDVGIIDNMYPAFWLAIRKEFPSVRINYDLKCPMNYIDSLQIEKMKTETTTLPMSSFYKKYECSNLHRAKKVEELISTFSLDLLTFNKADDEISSDDYYLLKNNYDELINSLKKLNLGKKYVGLFSWLINRAFIVKVNIEKTKPGPEIKSNIRKNKSLLMKTLYDVNPDALRMCLLGRAENVQH